VGGLNGENGGCRPYRNRTATKPRSVVPEKDLEQKSKPR